MRALIYGAGAMGTVLGAHIARSGQQTDLCTHNRAHLNALKKSGAHVTGSVDFTVPVNAYAPDELTGGYDVIFLMTKQRNNREVLTALLPHLKEDGVVCTTQNGLPEPSVAAVAGEERCCGCAVSWGATFVGGGEARLTSSPDALCFSLGTLYNKCNNLNGVKTLLSCMGKVTVEDNFMGARWIKLSVNSAFSALSAISGLTFGEVACGDLSKMAALGIFNECTKAAKANGIKPEKIQGHDLAKLLWYNGAIKKKFAEFIMPYTMKNHADLQSGMLFDLKNGKKCEADFINGVVLSYARAAGLDAPYNALALEIIGEIEQGKRGISPDNIKLFKKLF